MQGENRVLVASSTAPPHLSATILRFTSLVRSRLLIPARTVALPARRLAVPTAPLAMPPKRTSSKRAAADEVTATKEDKAAAKTVEEESPLSELSGSEQEKQPKKKRAKKPPVTPLDPSVPTNKEVPQDLAPFPRPAEGCVRISAWNVAGLRASEKKGASGVVLHVQGRVADARTCVRTLFSLRTGFSRYVDAEDADILVVTETKVPELSLPALDDRYEVSCVSTDPCSAITEVYVLPQYRYWGDHSKKGHAGTAIFSKMKPLNVTRGFQRSEEVSSADSEGRMITLEFENSYVVGTCASKRSSPVPNLPSSPAPNFPTRLHANPARASPQQLTPSRPSHSHRRSQRWERAEDFAGEGEVEPGVRDLLARTRCEEASHLVRRPQRCPDAHRCACAFVTFALCRTLKC